MARFSQELQDFFFPSVQPSDEAVLAPNGPTDSPTDTVEPNAVVSAESVSERIPEPALDASSQERVTLSNVLELAGERTFGFLLVLLALPSALPIPAPGYSAPFGVLIILVSAQMMVGLHRPWFPDKIRASSLSRKQAQGLIKAGLPWLKRLESFSKPRLSFISNTQLGRIVIGLIIILMGIFMMIPIPGTNTIPAMIVFILGFSLIEEDGFISLMGLAAGFAGGSVVALTLAKGLPLLLDKLGS